MFHDTRARKVSDDLVSQAQFYPETGGIWCLIPLNALTDWLFCDEPSSEALSFKQSLKGERIVDLASGRNSFFAGFAESLGASSLTAIDICADKLSFEIQDTKIEQWNLDMIEGLRRFKDESVKLIIISGLEPRGGDIHAYFEALAPEIKRVLKPEGVLLLDKIKTYDTAWKPERHGFMRLDALERDILCSAQRDTLRAFS